MKQLFTQLSKNSYQLLAMLAGAIIFAFLFWSFTGNQSSTEKLLGLTFDDDKSEVTISVTSSGCTAKNDFQFKVKNNTIEIVRKKKDLCKRMPFVTSFTYTLKEAGLDANKTYTIKNKFVANPNIANIP